MKKVTSDNEIIQIMYDDCWDSSSLKIERNRPFCILTPRAKAER